MAWPFSCCVVGSEREIRSRRAGTTRAGGRPTCASRMDGDSWSHDAERVSGPCSPCEPQGPCLCLGMLVDARHALGGPTGPGPWKDLPLVPRYLAAQSELPDQRAARRHRAGKSAGETYAATLRQRRPGAQVSLLSPADEDAVLPSQAELAAFDAVFLAGSPMHVHTDTPPVERQLAFMRAVFASGVPSFGSCAGLQVAVAAAGGRVRKMPERMEAGVARRISPPEAGQAHPLLKGRPASRDAAGVHGDEVEALPPGATLLASHGVTKVQAAEIRFDRGVFGGGGCSITRSGPWRRLRSRCDRRPRTLSRRALPRIATASLPKRTGSQRSTATRQAVPGAGGSAWTASSPIRNAADAGTPPTKDHQLPREPARAAHRLRGLNARRAGKDPVPTARRGSIEHAHPRVEAVEEVAVWAVLLVIHCWWRGRAVRWRDDGAAGRAGGAVLHVPP